MLRSRRIPGCARDSSNRVGNTAMSGQAAIHSGVVANASNRDSNAARRPQPAIPGRNDIRQNGTPAPSRSKARINVAIGKASLANAGTNHRPSRTGR